MSETYGVVLEKATVTALKDVDFGVVDLGVRGAVDRPISRAQMLCARIRVSYSQVPEQQVTYKVGARFALNSQWKMRTTC